jgi:hypothetical protein
MVELLPNFPPHVAAYRASGLVDPKEYEQVVMDRVNEVADKYGRINFLVRLETDLGNYSIGAFLKYLKISFQHFTRWDRMAIVTDQGWVRAAYDMLSPLVHGEVRGYKLQEFQTARQWVSAAPEKNKRKDGNISSRDIIFAGMAGTSAMTAFSYLLSALQHKNFKEPRLLAFLYSQWKTSAGRGTARKAGWKYHYSMGISWAYLYAYLIRKRYMKPDRKSSVAIGALSGVLAVACWKSMFAMSSRRPPTDEKKFYLQLVPGHIIFALITIAALRRAGDQGL